MSLLRDFSLSAPYRNILKEISDSNVNLNYENINEIFTVRKQIYDNKELFYKIAENDNIEIADNKDEIKTLTENVKKGRQMLVDELSKNRQLLNDKTSLEEFKSLSLDICNNNLQKMNNLKLYFDNQEINSDELQNNIDTIEYAIGNIVELIEKNFAEKAENINLNFNKNNAMIKTLSGLYNVFKSTSSLHVCPACMSNESEVFCSCGHTFCKSCIEKSRYCYLCRAPVGKLHNLFFN
jgi:hypothetical protein